jgi:cathepsin F
MNCVQTLSPQQIVSCDKTDGGCDGNDHNYSRIYVTSCPCSGGDTPTAYQYVIDAGGLMLEKDYPYTGKNGICKMDNTKVLVIDTHITNLTLHMNDPPICMSCFCSPVNTVRCQDLWL